MYRWIITEDKIEYDLEGICGPSNYDESVTDNRATFELYDDDGNCYAEGYIWGDYDGLEPLDDFGMPSLGCTAIKIDGEWV